MINQINIIVQIIEQNPGFVISGFIILMLFFASQELKSFKQDTFKDYKSLIVSVGILGTFIGIFCGLWNFDTKDIDSSVPKLLEGLKLAFTTSILGMGIAIILSAIEHSKKQNPTDIPDILKVILSEQKKAYIINTEIFSSFKDSRKEINNHFKIVNESLKKALETLSKGATEEIIRGLKTVIVSFNENLKEQFGENFKQLNESVKNMIVWQENYKTAIERIEQSLKTTVANIENTSEYTKQFLVHYQQISHISTDLKNIIEVNQNQINNMESHLENLNKIGENAKLVTASIDDFSKVIKDSLSAQSAGLNRLSEDLTKRSEQLTKEMRKSSDTLNTVLTALTDKFRKDYEHYLKKFAELLSKLSPK